jgi:large subunit ribosomal protein L21
MASTTTSKKAPAKVAATKKVSTKKAVNSENSAFAVIATGGKQYIVRVGDVITIEKMDGDFTEGQATSFDQVLLTNDGSTTKVGAPTVSGVKVSAELIEAGRDKKVMVVKYKAKSRYLKKNGHRQPHMKFKITAIA